MQHGVRRPAAARQKAARVKKLTSGYSSIDHAEQEFLPLAHELDMTYGNADDRIATNDLAYGKDLIIDECQGPKAIEGDGF
jgi:hypothetical protein